MNMSALTHKSFADITRRLSRTILVILGIMIGVFGLTAINLTTDAVQSAFAYINNHTASPNISFLVQKVDPSLAASLAGVSNVQSVQIDTQYASRWHVTTASGHVNIVITGYEDFSAIKFNPFQLLSGRLPGSGEILMESGDRALQSFAIGDTVKIDTPNGVEQLRVVGTARTQGQNPAFSGTAIAYMSAAALHQVSGLPGANDIQVKVLDKNKVNATAKALDDDLHANGVTVLNTSIIPDTNISVNQVNGLLSIMKVLSMIALLLAGFLIFNTISTLVAEQTRFIGTMKAIGGSRRTIVRSYLMTVGIYGVVGTALGLALGILGGYLFTGVILNLANIDLGPYQMAPGIIVTSVLVGLGVPFAAALLPLWLGTRITVRDALAEYGTSSAHGGKSESKMGRRLTWVPQTTWLGVRGVFRKRGRAILTLLALTLSATAFLAIQTTTYSYDQSIGKAFDVFNYDVQVNLASPRPFDQVRTRIMAIPNVGHVERTGFQMVKTQWGQMGFEGFEANTQEYRHQLVAGRWFNGDEPNALIISNVVADSTHLKVGDSLTLSGPTSNTVTWKVIGEVHDTSAAAAGEVGVGLTTIDDLNAFIGLPANLTQTVLVQGVDRSPMAIDKMANALDDTLSKAGLSPMVLTTQQVKNLGQNQLQIVYYLLDAVAAIVALVGILGMFNTLTTSVLERRREIGILRSMGATGRRVGWVFWLEAISLAVFAWLVAIVIGIPASYAFVSLISTQLYAVAPTFNPIQLVEMLIFIILIATLASFGPVLRASRVRIAHTLRYE